MSLCHPNGLVTFSGLATSKSRPMGLCAYSVAALPADPVGNFTLTLTNVSVGSTLRVESQSAGTTLYDGTAATSSPVITLSCYAGGGSNDLNNLRIKVRKGTSSPFYQPYETLATAFVGAQSIFVSQISDE